MKIMLVLTAILGCSVFQINTIQVVFFSLGAELGKPVWDLIRSLFLTERLPGLLENCFSLVYRGAEYAEGFFPLLSSLLSTAFIPAPLCWFCCIIQVLLVFLQLSGTLGSTGEQLCTSPEREAEQEGLWTPAFQPGSCAGSCSSLQGAE